MPILWLLGGGAALWGASKIAQNTAQAADNTGDAALKLVAAGAIALIVAKKYKLI